MRFLAGKCSKMRLRPGLRPGPRWGSLQRSPSAANLFTVDSRRVVPARYNRGVIARTRYINVVLTD